MAQLDLTVTVLSKVKRIDPREHKAEILDNARVKFVVTDQDRDDLVDLGRLLNDLLVLRFGVDFLERYA